MEYEIDSGTFIPPNRQTVSALLEDFVSLYGEENWALSTYTMNVALIDNYINPIIGDELVQNMTPKFVDQYYKKLKKTKPVAPPGRRPKSEYVGSSVSENVHILLR